MNIRLIIKIFIRIFKHAKLLNKHTTFDVILLKILKISHKLRFLTQKSKFYRLLFWIDYLISWHESTGQCHFDTEVGKFLSKICKFWRKGKFLFLSTSVKCIGRTYIEFFEELGLFKLSLRANLPITTVCSFNRTPI